MVIQTLVLLAGSWVIPSGLAAGVVMLIIEVLRLLGVHAWWIWGLLSPTFYLCWLIGYLFFSGVTLRQIERRYPRPRRASFPGKTGELWAVFASGARRASMENLPLLQALKSMSWGLPLVIWAYSPPMRIGEGVNFMPPKLPEDPDLTELGDYVVLGADVAIAAHFWKTLPDGKRLFVRAPVKIGSRATIGAYSLVSLGCSVGEDAIIEPHSYLAPYTTVPSGEVWGGRPAVFLRRNSRAKTAPSGDEAASVGQE